MSPANQSDMARFTFEGYFLKSEEENLNKVSGLQLPMVVGKLFTLHGGHASAYMSWPLAVDFANTYHQSFCPCHPLN